MVIYRNLPGVITSRSVIGMFRVFERKPASSKHISGKHSCWHHFTKQKAIYFPSRKPVVLKKEHLLPGVLQFEVDSEPKGWVSESEGA